MFELNIKAAQCHERVRPVLYAQMGERENPKCELRVGREMCY
jgi:hypothetical protein